VARAVPDKQVMSVGRDGASDAVSFMAAGIPAVEFGPDGAGHHGPDEWVSISSLARYRRSLVSFVRILPMWLERPTTDGSAAPGENGHLPGEAVVDGGLL
jgi:succinyl-diaminopimelate desuccinylase